MKVFWLVIATLAVAAAALLFSGNSRSTTEVPHATTPADPPTPSLTGLHHPDAPDRSTEPTSIPSGDNAHVMFADGPATASSATPIHDKTEILPATEADANVSASGAPAGSSTATAASASPAAAPVSLPSPAPTATNPSTAPDASPMPHGAPAEAAPAKSALRLIRRDDGTLLINDRWVVKGDGSAEKPYEVTWEYLISAGETYDPKAGQNDIPPHISMLDGTHVRITGWIAFPLYVQSATELLVMLNQWDGCCIGVPPTPYDAIEVRLRAPAEGDARQATFGTVQGIMSVKPYVVGGWLVGLYVMDQARIIPGRFNDGGS